MTIKKSIFTGIILLFFNNIIAQENNIKLGLLFGNYGIQYEHSFIENLSLVGQLGYSDLPTRFNNNDSKSTGFGYYFEARYYISKNKNLMEGWHIGPNYTFLNLKNKNDDNLKTSISSFGFVTGYQWIFDSNFTLGCIIGIGTLKTKSDIKLDLGGIKFLPNLGITLGYKF